MTDATDLDDYVDPPVAAGPAEALAAAKAAAILPKPSIREMIDTLHTVGGELEGAQERLLIAGARDEPYQPYMRRAAILVAAANFLALVDSKREAVRKALAGKS